MARKAEQYVIGILSSYKDRTEIKYVTSVQTEPKVAKWDDGKLPNYSEWCSANSYIGWLKWCDSWRLFEKYIEPIVNALVAYYKFVIKKDAKPKARNNAVIKYVNKIYQKKGRVAA